MKSFYNNITIRIEIKINYQRNEFEIKINFNNQWNEFEIINAHPKFYL